MTTKASKTLHGTVTVTVGDETYTLTPTLVAVRAIEARFGGLLGAMRAVDNYSVDGVSAVIAAGGMLATDAAEALPEKVWQAGVVGIAKQLVPYMVALVNPSAAEGAAGNVPKVSAQ